MLESDPQRRARAGLGLTPQSSFAMLAIGFLVLVGVWAYGFYGSVGATLACIAVFAVVVIPAGIALPAAHPHDAMGSANAVTLVRAGFAAVMVGELVAPAVSNTGGWTIFLIASVALAMDGLDGYLARRAGLCSAFGARFDMEVDAVLAATLSLIVLSRGTVGPEILILGFTRYVFVGASWVLPWLRGELPDRFRRKLVCVVQIGTLIGLICPLVPAAWHIPASLVASGLLIWSFAVDIVWLKRMAA